MVQVRRAGALKLDTARSKNFLRLAHETRRSYAGLIRRNIEKDLGDFPLAALSDLASLGKTTPSTNVSPATRTEVMSRCMMRVRALTTMPTTRQCPNLKIGTFLPPHSSKRPAII